MTKLKKSKSLDLLLEYEMIQFLYPPSKSLSQQLSQHELPHSDSDHMRSSTRHSLILFRLFSHFLLLSLSIWQQMTSEWQNSEKLSIFLPKIKDSHSLHLRVLDVKVDATLTLEERNAKDIACLAKYYYSVFPQKSISTL